MKYVKSKNVLIACTLSTFLVQITGSVYSLAAKPAKITSFAAKPTLKTVPPVTITIPVLLTDIALGDVQYHSTDSDHSFIDALNRGETFTETIQADGTLTLKSSSTLAKGQFPTDPSQIYYKCAGDFAYKNITVHYGTTVTIQGTAPNIPTVHITIPGQLEGLVLGNKSYTAASYKDLFAAFNRGAIFTGVVDYMGDLAIYSKESYPYQIIGSITDSADQISYMCTGDANYANTKVSAGTSITMQVINAPPPPETSVTFITPANVIDIQLNGTSGYSNFSNKTDFIAALNTGATFTGVIADNPKGALTLTNADKSKTFTGTFNGMPKNILYQCLNDLTYTASNPATYGTKITIKGTNAPPPAPAKPIVFTIPANVTNITLVDVGSDFSDKTALISALNKGQTFTGTITNGGALTLTNADKSISSQGVFLNSDPKSISYQCSGDTAPTIKSVTKGATVTIIGSIPPPPPPPTTKTVTITVPAGTISFGDITILGTGAATNINNDFSKFNNDLLINGLQVTGVVTDQEITWKYSGKSFSSSANSKPTGLAVYANPKNPIANPNKPNDPPNFMFNVGDTINIMGIKAPSVTINIPANLQDLTLGKNSLVNSYPAIVAALNNGETFTGTIDLNKTLTLKSKTSSTIATGTFWTENQIAYFCTGDKEYTHSVILNPGTIVTITGTKTPPPVTIIIPSTVSEILLGGTANSSFDNTTTLLDVINKGETVVGTINSSNALTLASATTAKIATGTFVTKPNQISYRCVGDAGYTNISVNPGTFVTITLNKAFTIDLTTTTGFANFTNFNLVTASGKQATSSGSIDPLLSELSNMVRSGTIYGKCSQSSTTSANGTKVELYDDQDRKHLLATFTSPETVAWIAWTTNNNTNSDGKLNINILYIAQQNDTFQITIKYPPATTAFLAINPFITLDMYKSNNSNTSIIFFSKFNAALAISNKDTPSNPRQAAVDNDHIFLPALSDCVNNPYAYIGNNNYAPLFNSPRYIYGKFSNNGATLQLYKDQAYQNGIGTFKLPSPQKGEYIYKLLWHTDAYTPSNSTNDPRVGPNGNIRYWVLFDENIAQNNGSFIIELINPNDRGYKTLSQITDFTNLTFVDTNNNTVTFTSIVLNRINTIYQCKDNPATTSNDSLIEQALDLADNSSGDGYDHSHGYHPRMLMYHTSNKIVCVCSYNNMRVRSYETAASIAKRAAAAATLHTTTFSCNLEYQEMASQDPTYEMEIDNFIININIRNVPLLLAPILNDQVFFYLDAGFSPQGGSEETKPYITDSTVPCS